MKSTMDNGEKPTATVIMDIFCGTYEQYLLGYSFIKFKSKYELIFNVADHFHTASLRSIAMSSSHCLATGSADTQIGLYNPFERRQRSFLQHHTGSVTALAFALDGKILISGGEDGLLSILKISNCNLLHSKSWEQAHTGKKVNIISVHPSGKLALTIGEDHTMRTWDIVNEKCTYTLYLSEKYKTLPNSMKWAVCGKYFGIVVNKSLDIYKLSSGTIVYKITCDNTISCIEFLQENKVCIGDAGGKITCYNFKTSDELWKIDSNHVPIKTLCHFQNKYLIIANRQGLIEVYRLQTKKEGRPKLLAQANSSCRITCMTVYKRPKINKSFIDEEKNKMEVELKEIEQQIKLRTKHDFTSSSYQNWEISNI